jgi:hypothetical protein
MADLSDKGSYDRWSKNPKRSVILFRYEIDGDRLKLFSFDSAKLAELDREGELKKHDLLITAESLAAICEKHGAKAIWSDADVMVFKKAK